VVAHNQPDAVRLALLEAEQAVQKEVISALRNEVQLIESRERERDRRDRAAWRAGVTFLGGLVLALLGVIWAGISSKIGWGR
jgi:hypothetical protein